MATLYQEGQDDHSLGALRGRGMGAITPSVPPAAANATPVAEQMEATVQTVRELHITINSLEQKLVSVRRISPPGPASEVGPAHAEPILLTGQIATLREDISGAAQRIALLVRELEV